jgi:hypothetical protein
MNERWMTFGAVCVSGAMIISRFRQGNIWAWWVWGSIEYPYPAHIFNNLSGKTGL